MPNASIPMTILGGYLGSGKTTFINGILSSANYSRVAVIVNDFGAVNIDADLIESASNGTIELTNGCICCNVADGMAAVIDRLGQADPPPEHVLVEVSGVGDPSAVAAWASYPGFRRHGVVVCVDVSTILERAQSRWVSDTVLGQLWSADHLLFTKVDLVSAMDLNAVRNWIGGVAPGIPVIEDRSALTSRVINASVWSPLPRRSSDSEPPFHREVHESWTFTTTGLVHLEAILDYLNSLPPVVVRAKGAMQTRESPSRRTIVQLSGRQLQVSDDGIWRVGDESRLVLISGGPAPLGVNLQSKLPEPGSAKWTRI